MGSEEGYNKESENDIKSVYIVISKYYQFQYYNIKEMRIIIKIKMNVKY